jgi:hypothetical protein
MAQKKSPDSSTHPSVEIEKERQKTIRYFMFIAVFAVIALVAIYIIFGNSGAGGKRSVDIDLSKGTIALSVDQPIVEQVKQPVINYDTPQGTVQFTTGKVEAAELDKVNTNFNLQTAQPTEFTGKNFINNEVGFLLTVENPQFWQVAYNPQGITIPVVPVNTIYESNGNHLNVNIERLQPGMDLQGFVTQSLQSMVMLGVLSQMPEVSYDLASQTAFLEYANPQTGGQSYQKVVLKGNVAYIASANYNNMISDPKRVQDLIKMVATFTLIV